MFAQTPCLRWLMPMHQRLTVPLEVATQRATWRMSSAVMLPPQVRAAASGVYGARDWAYSAKVTALPSLPWRNTA